MANEVTVPLLPCRSIDEVAEFYEMLGFTRTHYQQLPNPHVALRREDLNLHFFGMPGFKPEDSYGSCLVIVPDIRTLYEAFAAAMRRTHGKLLVSGIPRMTRPRKRKNDDGVYGFAIIDPGGNWIRITASRTGDASAAPELGKLGLILQNAVVMGDSHGLTERAAAILDGGLERLHGSATPVELVEALAYRAELAVRSTDTEAASSALERARSVPLSPADRSTLAETLTDMDDLAVIVGQAASRSEKA